MTVLSFFLRSYCAIYILSWFNVDYRSKGRVFGYIVYPISRLVLYLTEILTSPSGLFTFLFFCNVDLIEAEERIGVFILQIPQKSHLS